MRSKKILKIRIKEFVQKILEIFFKREERRGEEKTG
jgi:hypothetical protein